ncbi:MAG: AAA family ATPase, partial [Oscillospiraceae bacterium]
MNQQDINKANCETIVKIANEIKKVVLDKDETIKILLTTLIAGGHALIEDVPGVGKTTLSLSIAKSIGCIYSRTQFTPDVMPSDITGFMMFNRQTNVFEYKEGSIMANIFLADEINRTSPKTQSSLLEAMEEGNVTVDGQTYKLPSPFMVIATQNPAG